MAKINTTNYLPVTSWNGTQDLLIVEQPDGTKVATPEQIKQYVEAGNFTATGEITDGHGNVLSSAINEIGDLSQTGLTGDSVAAQLDTAREQIATKANTTDVNTALAGKADITTVTIPAFTPSQAGWRRICKVKPVNGATVEGMIYVGGEWINGQPPSASIALNIRMGIALLTLLSSAGNNDNRMTAMRLIHVAGSDYWLDVYFPAYSARTGTFKLIFTGDIAVSDIQNPISITTDATAATAEISLNQQVSGTVLTDKSIAQAQVIKRKHITGTTSANGNVQLNDFAKSNTVIVGCQMQSINTAIVAVPYTYSGLTSGKWGLHCTSEASSGDAIVNKNVEGYIYYVEMPAYD